MKTIGARLEQQHPNENQGWSTRVQQLQEHVVGGIKPALLVLMAAVGFVLLIACANVANLLLARAAARQKEIAIRAAVGASPRRLARQLLIESLLIALLGGALGMLLSLWGVQVLGSLTPESIPRVREASLDFGVLGFTLVVAVATGLLFGLAPAVQAARTDLNATLKEGGKTSGAAGHQRLRNALVVFEVATAVLLLTGAGLLIRSFLKLQSVDPGFRPEHVITMEVPLPGSDTYREPGRKAAFFEQVLERQAALAGVRKAGAISILPLGGGENIEMITIEGRPVTATRSDAAVAGLRMVTPGYFAAMGIALLEGRVTSEYDRRDSQLVAVIDEAMATAFWTKDDPVGKRFKLGDENSKAPWMTVVGVVRSVRHSGLHDRTRPQFFVPYPQLETPAMTLVVRTAGDPLALAAALKKQVLSVDKDQPVSNVRTLENVLSASVALPRFRTVLLGAFAGLALLLATVGVYGVISYTVSQRTREIGLRVALGADRANILRLVVGQGLGLALAGIAGGIVLSFALTRLLAGLLYGVGTTDPITLTAVAIVLAVVAAVASFVPARRAMRVEPTIALRYE
jgi:putative ABC transport system permease protein